MSFVEHRCGLLTFRQPVAASTPLSMFFSANKEHVSYDGCFCNTEVDFKGGRRAPGPINFVR